MGWGKGGWVGWAARCMGWWVGHAGMHSLPPSRPPSLPPPPPSRPPSLPPPPPTHPQTPAQVHAKDGCHHGAQRCCKRGDGQQQLKAVHLCVCVCGGGVERSARHVGVTPATAPQEHTHPPPPLCHSPPPPAPPTTHPTHLHPPLPPHTLPPDSATRLLLQLLQRILRLLEALIPLPLILIPPPIPSQRSQPL